MTDDKFENLEPFIGGLLSQEMIPLTAKYQHNDKIEITLQLVDKGFVVGYQDFRVKEDNMTMRYADIAFLFQQPKRETKGAGSRIDDFINKVMGNQKQLPLTDKLATTSKQLATLPTKTIDIFITKQNLRMSMIEVALLAERIYWMNSGLQHAAEKRRITHE